MPSIIVTNVSFSYGSHLVLDRVSLQVGAGERAFLVGPNGSGKTTLLKLLTGQLAPDSGQLVSGPFPQTIPDEGFEGTVEQFIDVALAPLKSLAARFEQVTAALASGEAGCEGEYDELLAQMSARDVWSLQARIGETLSGLGLSDLKESGFNRQLATLSPGQRSRVRLAALLLLAPEVLILDEPTNHLDEQATSFLVHTLKNWPGPVLATSHDRAFIEESATVIYDLDISVWQQLARAEGKGELVGLVRNAGNYSAYLEAKTTACAKRSRIYADQQAQKRGLREHRQESMHIAKGGVHLKTASGMAKKFFADRAAATSVKRTRNDDVRLSRLAQQEVRKPRLYQLDFPCFEGRVGGALAVCARQASVCGRLSPVSFDLSAGEHLLVTGPNGSGKSTLLNWITTAAPAVGGKSSGVISRAEPVSFIPQRLPLESDAGFGPLSWREGIGERGKGILHPSMWSTPIWQLSAGNQRRAQLAVALANSPAVLIMDEPTNYLDLETMHVLEDALRAWRGTLILASHDRWLIQHWHGRKLQLTPPTQPAL
jgi:ABC superfamily ATP binding cassette transporter ABC protein